MALIELGPDAPAPSSATTAPPAYVYRRFGLVLVSVLLLALGGAAPVHSRLWERTGLVEVPIGTDFQLAGDRLYTLDFGTRPPVIAAWSLDGGRKLWSVPGPDGSAEEPYYFSEATPGLLLINVRRSTTVLDARTGAVAWRSSTPLGRLDDRTGLVVAEEFRPGTEYDPESGAPGRLYGSTTELLHTEPARSTTLSGVDLGTGRRLWSASWPGSVSTAWTGAAIVVLSARKLTVRSARDGAVLRERDVPPVDGAGPVWGEVVGENVLVHYGAFGEGGRVTAYAVSTLDQRWQLDEPDPQGSAASCAGVPCVRTPSEVRVLDAATGRPTWQAGASVDLRAFGPGSVLEVSDQNDPVRAVDRATGEVQAELGRWQGFFPVRGSAGAGSSTGSPDRADVAYMLTRAQPDSGTAVGLLRAGRTAVQPLGKVPDTVFQCQAGPDTVACRVVDGIGLYRYRA